MLIHIHTQMLTHIQVHTHMYTHSTNKLTCSPDMHAHTNIGMIICTFIYRYAHTGTHVCTCTQRQGNHACICRYTHTCPHVCISSHRHTCSHACTGTQAHVQTGRHRPAYRDTQAHIYIHISMHTTYLNAHIYKHIFG